jgi:CheY-like chemotaxis protein
MHIRRDDRSAPRPAMTRMMLAPITLVHPFPLVRICDGESAIRELLHFLAVRGGWRVECFASSHEALTAFTRGTAELLITEYHNVCVDNTLRGLDLIARVKLISPTTRCLLHTSWSLNLLHADDNLRLADHVLAKPTSMAVLQDQLARPGSRSADSFLTR